MDVFIPSEKEFLRLVGNKRVQFMKGEINGCCKQPGNLYSADKDSTGRVTVWRCRTCGRNHYRLVAEPGKLGVTDMAVIQQLFDEAKGGVIDIEKLGTILANR